MWNATTSRRRFLTAALASGVLAGCSSEVRFSGESIKMLAAALEFDPARRPRVAGVFAAPLVNDLTAAPA